MSIKMPRWIASILLLTGTLLLALSTYLEIQHFGLLDRHPVYVNLLSGAIGFCYGIPVLSVVLAGLIQFDDNNRRRQVLDFQIGTLENQLRGLVSLAERTPATVARLDVVSLINTTIALLKTLETIPKSRLNPRMTLNLYSESGAWAASILRLVDALPDYPVGPGEARIKELLANVTKTLSRRGYLNGVFNDEMRAAVEDLVELTQATFFLLLRINREAGRAQAQ